MHVDEALQICSRCAMLTAALTIRHTSSDACCEHLADLFTVRIDAVLRQL